MTRTTLCQHWFFTSEKLNVENSAEETDTPNPLISEGGEQLPTWNISRGLNMQSYEQNPRSSTSWGQTTSCKGVLTRCTQRAAPSESPEGQVPPCEAPTPASYLITTEGTTHKALYCGAAMSTELGILVKLAQPAEWPLGLTWGWLY